ncbi:hypothetical protein AC1659_27480 [Rhodococcus erythropolis]|jgi:hypothetical protein|uniref:hypothetical protein n=1 Tax=Rhodococcus TaxID=1827 RepID=UPI000E4F7D27|nr:MULTISPECIES: hypothetical protein [Rhodococcus]MBS2993041.1 hypothetical protein [Rhodococcus erythropolis]MDV8128507.1 hypothetical protein [Rhodococcus sp. IEGM 1304]
MVKRRPPRMIGSVRVSAYPGQGRRMVAQGAVICLVGVAIGFVGIWIGAGSETAGFPFLVISVLVGGVGVYRNYRGNRFLALEDAIGPSLFEPDVKGR